jgi:pSer/pThr/pTyr-binding forkhead associated (FHA) protein
VIAPLEADQIPGNAPRTLAGFLASFETNPLGQFWPIQQGFCLVGRKDAGASAEIEIDHPTTSSRHAKIYAAARPGRIKVEDLGSTNGTYVNERRLESGERRSLSNGDTVRFGGFSATIVLL